MKRVGVASLLLAGVVAAGVLSGCGLLKKKVVSEADIVGVTQDQLVIDATAIVAGEVVGAEMQNAMEGYPATDFLIRVTKVYKGDLDPGDQVEVRTTGGENEKMVYIPTEDHVTFEVGEKVVVFLTDAKGERTDRADFGYFVLGQKQGKFVEEDGLLKNEDYSFDAAKLEEEIRQFEERLNQ